MSKFILLGTSGCHLCEQAEEILGEFELSLQIIDIAEQEHWQTQYALRIPVLIHAHTQQDLGWPFDVAAVQDFIRTTDQSDR
ncbi:MAG: glutaredoxin family protein [Methylococcales bacterium]